MLESFTFAKDGPITTITFNRPERLNCMNREVMVELEGLIKGVRDDRDTRILIITGTGRAFSAGADMSAAKGVTDPAERQRLFNQRNRGVARMVGRSFDQITRLDCTTIEPSTVSPSAAGGPLRSPSISLSPQKKPSSGFPKSSLASLSPAVLPSRWPRNSARGAPRRRWSSVAIITPANCSLSAWSIK